MKEITRPKMAEILKPCSANGVVIDHFEIKTPTVQMLLHPNEHVAPGKYARLTINDTLYMSDTDLEWRTNSRFIHTAHGRVLISGLGLGFVIVPVLRKPEVKSLTVVECSADLVKLVEPQLRAHLRFAEVDYSRASVRNRLNDKLTIVTADAYEWKPAPGFAFKYDVIYHDIWAEQSTDALRDMTKLKRRYARRLAPGGEQFCWREGELRARLAQEKRAGW